MHAAGAALRDNIDLGDRLAVRVIGIRGRQWAGR